MKQANTISDRKNKAVEAVNKEFKMKELFYNLTGVEPSIISPEADFGAVFYPETKEQYLAILEALNPTSKNFTLTFAGAKEIPTFSPYCITYGGKHDTPNYMEVCVKFPYSVCPIWIKLPKEVKADKFSVSTLQGEHKGFGRYETIYTTKANGGTSVQIYYGENKTMYAANEAEATELKQFIFS